MESQEPMRPFMNRRRTCRLFAISIADTNGNVADGVRSLHDVV
jgi:hypothetical protein